MPKVQEATMPTTQTAAPQSSAPRRIACDRCHGQKLKCPRDLVNGGPCTRCAKAGALCQTSPARATGRPAKNPKPRPRKLESSDSVPSAVPSLTDVSTIHSSASSVDGSQLMPVISHGAGSTPEDFFPTPDMPQLPMGDGSKFYPTPDMQFGFVNIADDTFGNAMNFQYDDATANLLNYDPSLVPMMPFNFQDASMPMNFTYSDTEFGAMPQPMTPPLSLPDDMMDNKSSPDFDRRQSNFSTTSQSSWASHDALQQTLGRASFSSPLSQVHTMPEGLSMNAHHPMRSMSEDDTANKARRYSTLMTCTPQNEFGFGSSTNYSQALTSIQAEVDDFSRSLMSQSLGTNNPSDASVDVGVLLPIADKFMALIPQVCQSQQICSVPPSRQGSTTGFKQQQPPLERSQTEPTPQFTETVSMDGRSVDANLVQLVFACHTRLHFAFQIALDVISHNVINPTNASSPSNHPSSTIGSYTLPTSSPLSTLLHLHAISHCLDRLEQTLRKYLSESAPTAFFEGMFHTQKANNVAEQAFKVRAFEEAAERKSMLVSRIREIVAEVGKEF